MDDGIYRYLGYVGGNMCIALRRFLKKHVLKALARPVRGAVLYKVRGKAVPKAVGCGFFAKALLTAPVTHISLNTHLLEADRPEPDKQGLAGGIGAQRQIWYLRPPAPFPKRESPYSVLFSPGYEEDCVPSPRGQLKCFVNAQPCGIEYTTSYSRATPSNPVWGRL